MYNFSAIVLLACMIFSSPVWAENSPPTSVDETAEFYKNATAEKVVDYFKTLIDSYSFMYAAWPRSEPKADSWGAIMYSSMESIKYLRRAKETVAHLVVSSADANQVMTISATAFANKLDDAILAHESLLQYLREMDERVLSPKGLSEIQFRFAKFMSDRKHYYLEAFEAAQLPMFLLWENVPNEQQTGKIRWRVSDEQRRMLRVKISSKFGEDLKAHREDVKHNTNSYNPVLVCINAIDSRLSDETYEQSRARGAG